MGFFKEFKQDLSQAVNELTDDAAKMAMDDVVSEPTDDDVMVDTLSEELDEEITEADVDMLLEEIDTIPEPEEIVEPVAEPVVEEVVEPAPAPVEKKTAKKEKKEPVKEKAVMEIDNAYEDETTIITKGLKINGNIESDGSVELLGTVDGNVTCKGKLVVSGAVTGNTSSSEFFSNNARINGDVNCTGAVKIGSGTVIIGNLSAKSAVIAGAIKGNIDVHGPVIIDSTAILLGDIKSEYVQINKGAALEGVVSQCYSDNDPTKWFGALK